MANLNWKYVCPLKDGSEVDMMELKYHFRLPEDLKKCLEENNAGVPSLPFFDMGENVGMVFGGLLSFNQEDVDSIHNYINLFEAENGKGLRMFPFAIDPAGNFLCVESGKVVFYDHETGKTTDICDSFTEFLASLYG